MRIAVTGGREHHMRPLEILRLDVLRQGSDDDAVRSLCPHNLLELAPLAIDELYEGEAHGVDEGSRIWAEARGIVVRDFPADWYPGGKFDRGAGIKRNGMMLKGYHRLGALPRPDRLVAFDGGTGTNNAVETARKLEIPVLDLRGTHCQRWTADDVRKVFSKVSGPSDPQLVAAVVDLWASKGGGGPPIVQAHLLKIRTPEPVFPPGWIYCGRSRYGEKPNPLGNPFKKEDGDLETILDRFRDDFRRRFAVDEELRRLLAEIQPWTPLICWCSHKEPCHATIVADAALQLRARVALKRLGLSMPVIPAPPRRHQKGMSSSPGSLGE